nr:hypothetical protein HAGR004_26230 [Bdellovibrio sp. HAGR004]
MYKKWTDKLISYFVLLSFAGAMAPMTAHATSDLDALYDSQAEVESIEANLDEAKGGFNQSKEELETAHKDWFFRGSCALTPGRVQVFRSRTRSRFGSWQSF